MNHRSVLALSLCWLVPAVASAGGFAVFEQGSKATGLGGAFTAMANDPSTIFYNPAGLAYFEKGKAGGGVTMLQVNESLFQGRAPGRAAGTVGEQSEEMDLLPHAYVVKPLNAFAVLGIGTYSPFQLTTEWGDPDTFAGRDVATSAELTALDLATTLGLRVSPTFGVGLGLVGRASELSLGRREIRFNPLDRQFQDVAGFELETDMEIGLGFSAGWLHKPSKRFSWGMAYRSAIEIDYDGTGTLTQIATGNDQFDDLIAASLPLDQDLPFTTTLELPEVASLGLAFALSDQWALNLQGDWTGWSSFDALRLDFPNHPDFDTTIPERFDDSVTFRTGLLFVTGGGFEFRLGYAFDETPQPNETLGPLFVGGDKNVLSAGVGLDWLDLSVSYQEFDDRLVTSQVDGLDGLYRDNRLVVTITVAP